ncbi:MAG: hypothetical protein HC802_02205 [Caldilineaceae bacterium]|nr:hypothetical protein [Caldilineaceae bacterium]
MTNSIRSPAWKSVWQNGGDRIEGQGSADHPQNHLRDRGKWQHPGDKEESDPGQQRRADLKAQCKPKIATTLLGLPRQVAHQQRGKAQLADHLADVEIG